MKVNQFVGILKAGYSFDVLKTLIYMDLKLPTADKDIKKFAGLFVGAKKLPAYAVAQNQEKSREAMREALKKWLMKDLPEGESIVSVIDFSEKTGGRIGLTAENYSKYFDSLVSEKDEDEVGLTVDIYSANKKKNFKAVMHGKSERLRRQNAVAEYMPMESLDMDFISLRQYLIAVDGSEKDSKTTVAEAVARGSAYLNASTCVGAFVNRNFLKLFTDFF